MRDKMEILIDAMLDGRILLDEAITEFEKLYIQKALERNGTHLSKTATALGIHRNTLSKRLANYQAAAKKKNNHKRLTSRKVKKGNSRTK